MIMKLPQKLWFVDEDDQAQITKTSKKIAAFSSRKYKYI